MNETHHAFFVTGISTDVGKTVVSAILAEALHAAYWKPVQAGDLHYTDSHKVAEWTNHVEVLPETHRLNQPMSPHAAASRDGVNITVMHLPEVDRNLLIEGAGGLMVPLNDEGLLIVDLMDAWQLPAVVVSRHYLGSINHTLLTIEALKNRGIPVAGIVYVGAANTDTETIIQKVTNAPVIGRVPMAEEVTRSFVTEQAGLLREPLLKALKHVRMD